MHDKQIQMNEVEELISKINDLEMESPERVRLAQKLESSPESLEIYLQQVEMEAMLRETYGLLNRSFSAPITRKNRPRLGWRSLITATVVTTSLVCTVVGFMLGTFLNSDIDLTKSEKNSQETVAEVVKPAEKDLPDTSPNINISTDKTILCRISHRTKAKLQQLTGNSFSEVSDHELIQGQYRLEDGNIELSYSNGARVVLQSPAQFRLLSEKHLFLEDGRTSVNCPTQESKGFIVETPSGVATDLGTEFAIHVNAHGSSKDEFHVFDGKVSLRSKLHPYEFKLTQGQATQLDHKTSTPAGIDLDHQRFIRSFESTTDEYHQMIMSHQPVVYYAMRDHGDGKTILNETKDLFHGMILKADPDSPGQHFDHWACGFNGGTSFRMDGMKNQIYSVVPDYPKSQTNDLTVTAWIFAESRPVWGSIAKNWGHNNDPKSRGQFHFGLYAFSGKLEASINDHENQEIFAIDTEPLPLFRWHHVALVVNSTSLKLYRNGLLVASSNCHGLNGNPEIRSLAIGTKLGDLSFKPAVRNNSFWDGRIDHLAIFNHSLTDENIKELHQVGVRSAEHYQAK